jgi:(heptosyl)LPS beta-1,4-glucosyltransferase
MLTAVVLTRNEERHLPACLASLAWAPAVVVFDSYSTDGTVALAQAAGARVLQRVFDNYAAQRQAALAAVESEWVLFVDADERVPPALAAEIQAVLTPSGTPVAPSGTAVAPTPAWWIPRHNYLFGKLTLHAGWYPDYQLRLLRRALATYDPARPVHELAVINSPLLPGHLRAPLVHLNYETVAEFIAKQRDYARYNAGQLYAEGRRARPHNFVLQPLRQFFWRYLTLGGWKAGWHGLRLSLLMAYFELQKYRELARRQAAG